VKLRAHFFVWLLLTAGGGFAGPNAHADQWHPPAGSKQVPLWPGTPPDAVPTIGPEDVIPSDNLVAGKPWHSVRNVSNPTFTIFSPPEDKNTGVAVIVFPGGGYKELAIDLEGTEVCDWLTNRGITGVLLKYRVPNSGCHWDSEEKQHKTPKVWTALQDAQRAIGFVRKDAAKWGINPAKIGVLGFSAGGNLVAMISGHFSKRLYPPIDAADEISCRPDFAVAIYPGHMSITHTNISRYGDTKLNPDLNFNKQSPPTFLLHAKDDTVNVVAYSQLYEAVLKELGVPVETHLFEKGGHAFGLRQTELPITCWPPLVEKWLRKIGMIEN